jgi:hypothetical protein
MKALSTKNNCQVNLEMGVSGISEVPWERSKQSCEAEESWPDFWACHSWADVHVATNWYAIAEPHAGSYSLISGLYIPDPQGRHISTWTEWMYGWMSVQSLKRIGWIFMHVTSLLYQITKQKFPCTKAVSIQRTNAKNDCLISAETAQQQLSLGTAAVLCHLLSRFSSLDRHQVLR